MSCFDGYTLIASSYYQARVIRVLIFMCINIESCQPGTPTTKYGTTGNQLTKNDHSFSTPLPAQSVRDYLIRHTAMSLQFKSKPLRPLPLPLFPLRCPLGRFSPPYVPNIAYRGVSHTRHPLSAGGIQWNKYTSRTWPD